MTSVIQKVPFADLYAQYKAIKPEIDAAIEEVIRNSAFIRGHFVESFEKDFAKEIGVPHCVSCGNGTDALYIALHSLGVKPGDEIITTAHSWIATSETITQAGGRVVFCDTDADTFTISPADIEAKISPNTVGIIPVHLYGHPADMDAITRIARKHNLWVLEDCAQAHLAKYKGKVVGTFGIAAAFSFYPGKNLGAMGDAGAIVTSDGMLAERMAMFARHGGLVKGDHRIEGINSRMDGLHAAILSIKLRYLNKWTIERQKVAKVYDEQLKNLPGLTIPVVKENCEHVYHLYVIRHESRSELKETLGKNGIETVINYPTALPFLPAYARLNSRPEGFPNAYRNQSRVLSIPIFPEILEQQQQHVINCIKEFCAN